MWRFWEEVAGEYVPQVLHVVAPDGQAVLLPFPGGDAKREQEEGELAAGHLAPVSPLRPGPFIHLVKVSEDLF